MMRRKGSEEPGRQSAQRAPTFQAAKRFNPRPPTNPFTSMSLNPKRTIAELKDLRRLTGDDNGAQRVAFTGQWLTARAWLREKLQELPAEIHPDEAGNLWATLAGESKREL